MQSSSSYKGACTICRHEWTPAITGTQCTFCGYRTFVPADSRGRQARIQAGGHTYEYSGVETRPQAPPRDVVYARRCLTVVEAVGIPTGGHKTAPLVARLPGFDWRRWSPPELMHDSKIFVEMVLKCLVGKLAGSAFYNSWNNDAKHTGGRPRSRPHFDPSGLTPTDLCRGDSLHPSENYSTAEWFEPALTLSILIVNLRELTSKCRTK